MTKIDLGHLYLHRNRPAEAEAPLRDALRIQQTLYGSRDACTADGQRSLGICLTALDRYAEAEPLLQASLAVFQDQQKPGPTRQSRQALARLYAAWGKPAQAAAYQIQ